MNRVTTFTSDGISNLMHYYRACLRFPRSGAYVGPGGPEYPSSVLSAMETLAHTEMVR